MVTPEEKKVQAMVARMIATATRPLMARLDKSEREVRRIKTELSNVKSTVNRIKR